MWLKQLKPIKQYYFSKDLDFSNKNVKGFTLRKTEYFDHYLMFVYEAKNGKYKIAMESLEPNNAFYYIYDVRNIDEVVELVRKKKKLNILNRFKKW